MSKCLKVAIDNYAKFQKSIDNLRKGTALVGVPEENAERKEGEINNAALAYIHNFGAPESGIPAREFMNKGIDEAKDEIVKYFRQAAQAAIESNPAGVKRAYAAAGNVASSKIKYVITQGIPPPLSEETLKARARRKKAGIGTKKGAIGEMVSRGFGNAPSTEYAKPLIDTGGMYRAITYIVKGI